MKKKKLSCEEKVYKVLENLDDNQFAKFCFDYFGSDYIFDRIRESIADKENAKYALELAKSIK